MSQFHSLTLREVKAETRDAVSLSFELPDELQEQFKFTQGQYLTLRANLEGEEVRRSYSICTGVNDGDLRVAIKKVAGGVFSTYANEQLKAGSKLDVMPPQGKFFTQLNPEQKGNYLAIAVGSGITPVLSIMKTTLEVEPLSKFTLFYGNFATSTTMFREQLADLKNKYMERVNLIFLFDREQQDIDLYNGRIDGPKLDELFKQVINPAQLTAAFICGPQPMTETVRDSLTKHGLDKSKVHYELFTPAGGASTARKDRPETKVDSSAVTQVTVISDGRSLAFELVRNTQSILDAGNAIGADLPYSCKAGVCSTCRAKVVEGEVEMDTNHALEDYEVAAGYVLSCQCYPISDTVVLDYDQ